MGTGVAQMDVERQLNAHRVLSLALCFSVLVGWGAFAYAAGWLASDLRELRAELAQLKLRQDHLFVDRSQQEAVVNLVPLRPWTDPS